jgi:hypothetical protein
MAGYMGPAGIVYRLHPELFAPKPAPTVFHLDFESIIQLYG